MCIILIIEKYWCSIRIRSSVDWRFRSPFPSLKGIWGSVIIIFIVIVMSFISPLYLFGCWSLFYFPVIIPIGRATWCALKPRMAIIHFKQKLTGLILLNHGLVKDKSTFNQQNLSSVCIKKFCNSRNIWFFYYCILNFRKKTVVYSMPALVVNFEKKHTRKTRISYGIEHNTCHCPPPNKSSRSSEEGASAGSCLYKQEDRR